jgi:hypothetical protein
VFVGSPMSVQLHRTGLWRAVKRRMRGKTTLRPQYDATTSLSVTPLQQGRWIPARPRLERSIGLIVRPKGPLTRRAGRTRRAQAARRTTTSNREGLRLMQQSRVSSCSGERGSDVIYAACSATGVRATSRS